MSLIIRMRNTNVTRMNENVIQMLHFHSKPAVQSSNLQSKFKPKVDIWPIMHMHNRQVAQLWQRPRDACDFQGVGHFEAKF